MSVESTLTRELDIRFIDARSIATEAKLNLGIDGYYGEEQRVAIVDEALRIFNDERPTSQKATMKVLNLKLSAIKAQGSSGTATSTSGDSTEFSTAGDDNDEQSSYFNKRRSSTFSTKSNGSTTSTGSRFKMWPIKLTKHSVAA